jgi:cellulose synthase/poly-beta-1,6-N-acetylglucosamine synthase-like glycosyltransferase
MSANPMAWLFWVSFAFVAYVYLGYPLCLRLWARARPRRVSVGRSSEEPAVSIVIAARNEGRVLADRIENLLELDYSPERRQIVVVSDGSTDGTSDLLHRYRSSVDAVEIPAGGKARALNVGVERARHGVLVFTDARQVFAPDALRELVAPFADPAVGVVTGELLIEGEGAGRSAAGSSTIAEGIGLYWRYEKRIRREESAVHSTLGATGAIYAIRRALWTPLPRDTILDDVLTPMRAVLAGFRSVFTDRARAFDRPAADARAEARRKVRTLAGNYQLLWLLPALLVPWRNPVWFQFVSHKVGRLLVPYALVTLLVSSALLAGRSAFFAAAFAAQCLFYALAAYGAWLDRRAGTAARAAGRVRTPTRRPAWHRGLDAGSRAVDRLARIALTFLVLNGSAVAGLGAFVMRRRVWR